MRDELDTDVRAQSSRSSHDTTLQTWVRYPRLWHGADAEPFPITANALLNVAAIFKLRGYRSFANYLSRAKRPHIESGFGWSQVLDLAARDASRSVNRGLGPARQSAELDVVKVAALCDLAQPIVTMRPNYQPCESICVGPFLPHAGD
jgi:hypothetical protein